MIKDLILASIYNYDYNKVKCWLNSIKKSGFQGDIALVCIDVEDETINRLHEEGVMVYSGNLEPNQHIVVERFAYYWMLLQQVKSDYRFVICTDVSDVVFQRNPSEWLDKNVEQENIIASSESIAYKDETWGYHNIRSSFGTLIGDELNDWVIKNAGVIAGHPHQLINLFKLIYFMCDARPSQIAGGGGPDQAAYNIVLTTMKWEDVFFADSESAWAAQLGTTGDPHKLPRYEPLLIEPKPIMKDNLVCTSHGEPFYIVHQYNRVPGWREIIEATYE
jgi:hypothetical protein